jgi:hypothetical protein
MTFARYRHHIKSPSRFCIAPLHAPDSGTFPREITDITAKLKPTKIGRGPRGKSHELHALKWAMERGDLELARRTSIGAFLQR